MFAAMNPIAIGYFPRRPCRRGSGGRILPPQLEEMCNVGHPGPCGPPDWINLWLHNELWVYDTEARAWAVAADNANLHRLRAELSGHWDGIPGSADAAMDRYIARHVPLPEPAAPSEGARFDWDLYAYRMFPVRFAHGKEEPFAISLVGVQPLPEDYDWLGYDVVSRETDAEFGCSPLDCNGLCVKVAVNRYCLVNELGLAFRLATEWSIGEYQPDGSYVGPAEPGPYYVVEVFRKRIPRC
jgi:hypothetical protein